MKQKHRYRKKPKGGGVILLPPTVDAARVSYKGSSEHKARPVDLSYDVEPALRSDASACDPTITRDEAEEVLRRAILSGQFSAQKEGIFPRYVWAFYRGQNYTARLINQEAGWYKAWPIEEWEVPRGLCPLDRENDDDEV